MLTSGGGGGGGDRVGELSVSVSGRESRWRVQCVMLREKIGIGQSAGKEKRGERRLRERLGENRGDSGEEQNVRRLVQYSSA